MTQDLGLSKTNPLNDKRVLLSLSIDDIELRCEERDFNFDNLDIEKVFYLHRKYIENTVMDIFWDTLDNAIMESEIN